MCRAWCELATWIAYLKEIKNSDWCGILFGFFLGMLGNVVIDLAMSFWSYQTSTAKHRVEMTEKATSAIIKARKCQNESTAQAIDRHRYSLGVVIDRLAGVIDDPGKERIWR